MEKVSVLVPMYNVERYIGECARSLFMQSYQYCEFIFVDDASTDNTLEVLRGVIEEFPHLKADITCHELPKNGGVAVARNAALDLAKGHYILFVDADDWVDDEIVQKLVLQTIEAQADICNAWCMSVDAVGSTVKTPVTWMSSRRAHLRAVLGQSHLVPNHVRGMLFVRSLFEDNELRFTPGVDLGEDYSLLPQLIYYSRRLATLQEYLYFYRVENADSYMNNLGERHFKSYVAAQAIVSNFFESQVDALRYRHSMELGRVNIKKWLFKRGAVAKDFNKALFGTDKPRIKSIRLKLYNWAIDGGNPRLIWFFSACVNLPLFFRRK